MRPIPFAAILAIAAGPAAAAEVADHRVTVRLDPAANRIEAVDTVTLPAPASGFALSPQLTPTRLVVDGKEVAPRGGDGSWALPAGTTRFIVHYSGTLPPPAQEPGRHQGADAAFVGPEGAFLPAWSGWLPLVDGERVTFSLHVSVPQPHVAVATGDLRDETRSDGRYTARFVSERPGEPPSLFAGPYRVVERSGPGPLLRAYLHPELPEQLGRDYLDLSAEVIARFAEEIGPYPFSAFHVVSAPLPVGLGFPGMTYIDRRILPLPFIKAQSLPHEILHNWWGNGVVPRWQAGNWAEGLTTYMADYGLADADKRRAMRLNWLRDYAALPAERDQPVTAFRSKEHDAAQVVGYNKVAFIFHMLRQEIGDAAFSEGMRRFWADHGHEVAGWPDLQAAFEAAAGRKLDAFFRQWLERPGAPTLHLVSAKAQPGGSGWRTTVEIAQDQPNYDLRVPISIETAAGAERFHLDLSGREGSAVFVTRERPAAVAVDPAHDLFRRLAPGEAPPNLRDVTLAARPGVVIAAEGEAAQIGEALAGRLLDGEGRRLAPERAAAHDGPLLVIGTTAGVDRVLPQLALERWAEGPDAAGTSGRAWVARRTQGPVLVVSAADAQALEALARPLPHYGRESWIAFDGRKAVRKGSWEVADSPLRRPVTITHTP